MQTMKIAGFQKVTLIDYPNKIACLIFLYGCNFRCGFCHNPELVIEENKTSFSENEILDYLEKRKNYLDGICITGGEPLISIDKDFLKKIKKRGYSIKIETNGSFPEKLKELINENLVDFVSMDIKSSKEKYALLCDAEVDLNKIEESIKIIASLPEYEFRTTIIEDVQDAEEMKKIAEWLNEVIGRIPKRFVLQGFKKSGKYIDNEFTKAKDTSEEYLKNIQEQIKNYFAEIEIRV